MRVLYGVQATGNGHISRARAMGKYLQQHGVQVDYLFSGRPADQLFAMEQFGQFQTRSGLSFVTEQGQINYLKTALQSKPWQLWQDVRALDCRAYDLVLTDFEPVTALASRRQQVRSVAFGHQYAFLHQIPMTHDNWVSRSVFQHYAPARQQIGLHWHHFGQPILPPIVDLEPASHSVEPSQVLVYLPFEAPEQVMHWLSPLTDFRFKLYGPGLSKAELGHISTSPPCLADFKQDLHRSAFVLCNAGFELVSEALQLKKRILVKPLHRQMEQESNALALTKLQLGSAVSQLNTEQIGRWLVSDAAYQQVQYPNVAQRLSAWIAQGAEATTLDPKSWW
ncbi:MJ1255/VC2487 family glycosyltransferase [Rheinheimera sp.]|uniref:MJ1255/VC2487 family glycosyltransferase n=1 Tax=Rheinheimera sp. TaxID=1869214 RepID=UPI003AF89FE9